MPRKAEKRRAAKLAEKLRLPRGRAEPQDERELEVAPPDAEELELEAELFGGPAAAEAQAGFGEEQGAGAADDSDSEPDDGAWPAQLASIGASAAASDDDEPEPRRRHSDDDDAAPAAAAAADAFAGTGAAPKRAWVDEDDAEVVVDLTAVNRLKKLRKSEQETRISGDDYAQRLREQHRKLHPGVEWSSAKRPPRRKRASVHVEQLSDSDDDGRERREDSLSEEEDEEDDDLFGAVTRRAGAAVTVTRRPRLLPQGELGVKRRTNANAAAPSKCVVQSVAFHRNSQMMLTAGFDQTLRLFSVDGERNPLLQQVHVKDMPIHTAAFTPDGQSVLLSGRRPYFYCYDLQRYAPNPEFRPGVIDGQNQAIRAWRTGRRCSGSRGSSAVRRNRWRSLCSRRTTSGSPSSAMRDTSSSAPTR